jgi:tRNA-binding protein
MTPAPIKPTIEMADLEKIDVRVGTIVLVEEIANSDKLMKLTVSFGDHQRTIIAGIKQERAQPKEIEGKQALFIVNLAPRKMRGEVSEGMLSTLATRMDCRQCWLYRKKQHRTEQGQDEFGNDDWVY